MGIFADLFRLPKTHRSYRRLQVKKQCCFDVVRESVL